MSYSIGGQTFIRLDGTLKHRSRAFVNVTRAEADGSAFRLQSLKGQSAELFGVVDVISASNADALRTTYAGLIGTVVTVVMDGISRTNYFIHDAEVTAVEACRTPVGGISGGGYLVRSRWVLEYVGLS